MTSIGAISLDLKINGKGYNTQISNLANRSSKKLESAFGGTFGKIGKMAVAAFSVGAISKFMSSCLELGSNLTEVQNVVDTAFPHMSSQVDDFAKKAMTSFGLSETVTKKYLGTFGAMSQAFGFSETEAYKMSEALTALSGDVASFYNLSTDEAYTKLKSVFTGETESLKELGVVMTQTALDQYALQNGFGKTTSAMSEQEKVSLRLAFVQDKLAMASGDFAKTQNSWANQTRILTLRFENLKASLGKGFISLFTPIVKGVNWVLAALQPLADSFANLMEFLTGSRPDKAINSAASSLENAGISANNLSDGIKSSGDEATKTAKKIDKAFAKVDTINKLSFGSDDADSGGGSSGGNGNDSSIEGIGSAVTFPSSDIAENTVNPWIEAFKQAWEKGLYDTGFFLGKSLTDALGKIDWEPIKKMTMHWGVNIATFLNGAIEGIDWSVIGKTIAEGFNTALNLAYGFVTTFNFEKFGKGLGTGFDSMIKNIEWEKLATTISKGFIGLFDGLSGYLQAVDWKNVGKTVVKFINDIDWKSMISSASGAIGSIAGGFINLICGAVEEAMKSGLSDFKKKVKANGGNWIQTFFEELGKQISGYNFLKFVGDNIVSPFLDNLGEAFGIENLSGKLGPIGDGILDIVEFLFNPVGKTAEIGKGLIDDIWDSLKKGWDALSDKSFSIGVSLAKTPKQLWDWFSNGGFSDWIISIGNTLKRKASDLWKWFKGTGFGSWVISIANHLKSSARSLWSGFKKSGFGSWVISIKNKLSSTASSIFKSFKKAWSKAAKKALEIKVAIGNIIGNVKDWLNKNFIKKVNKYLPGFMKLPKLAKGGYVKANQPQLAMIGDNRRYGEIVAPEDKMLDMINTALKMQKEQNNVEGLDVVIALIRELIEVVKNMVIKTEIDMKKLSILLENAKKERQMIGG